MATTSRPPQYELRESVYRKAYARFETKPHDQSIEGHDSGAGYERWRSTEFRPHTARKDKEGVFVPHHRLLAVVACYPDDMPVSEILEHMRGKDVHHDAPEASQSRGVEWDNRPDCLYVRDHGTHSSITQAEMRAWAADDREKAVEHPSPPSETRCARCDIVPDVLCRVPSYDAGDVCLECSKLLADDEPVEVLE